MLISPKHICTVMFLLALFVGNGFSYRADTLLYDNFNDGDISDWSVNTSNGGIVTLDSTVYYSASYSLKVFSPTYMSYTSASSPAINFPYNRPYDVQLRFYVGSYYNDFYTLLLNGDIFLILSENKIYDNGYDLVDSVQYNTWYTLTCVADPEYQTYDVYLNGVYKQTSSFYPETTYNHLVFGTPFADGKGMVYYDDILVSVHISSFAIRNVPDECQPPPSGRTNWSAPMAAINLIDYWAHDSLGEYYAPGIMNNWSRAVASDSLGWFMATNGNSDTMRLNRYNSPVPGLPDSGTYMLDIVPGIKDFARWGGSVPDSFHIPHAPDSSKKDYTIDYYVESPDSTSPEKAWYNYWTGIQEGTPALLIFTYWNPQLDNGVAAFDTSLQESVYFYPWGPYTDTSAIPGAPEEKWGPEIGHVVTGIGYVKNYDPDGEGPLPDTNWVIVHDNWCNTPGNIAVPWANWAATIWLYPSPQPIIAIDSIRWDPDPTPLYTYYRANVYLTNIGQDTAIYIPVLVEDCEFGFWGVCEGGSGDTISRLDPGQSYVVETQQFYESGYEDSSNIWEAHQFKVHLGTYSIHSEQGYFSKEVTESFGYLFPYMDSNTMEATYNLPIRNPVDKPRTFSFSIVNNRGKGWSAWIEPETMTLGPNADSTVTLHVSRTSTCSNAFKVVVRATNTYEYNSAELTVVVRIKRSYFYDDFNDCDISDWQVDTSNGSVIEPESEVWVDPPCALHISSVNWATITSPQYSIPADSDYVISFYYSPGELARHFVIMDNGVVNLWTTFLPWKNSPGIRGAPVALWAKTYWEGSTDSILIDYLGSYNWYQIACKVYPDSQKYDVYLNGDYSISVPFPGDTATPYLKFGDYIPGYPGGGEGYWDMIEIKTEKLCLGGDVNMDGVVNMEDMELLADYLFLNEPLPGTCGDVNGDCEVTVSDLVYLSAYLFNSGPPPSKSCMHPKRIASRKIKRTIKKLKLK